MQSCNIRKTTRDTTGFTFRKHRMAPWVHHFAEDGKEGYTSSFCERCGGNLLARPAGHRLGSGFFGSCVEPCGKLEGERG